MTRAKLLAAPPDAQSSSFDSTIQSAAMTRPPAAPPTGSDRRFVFCAAPAPLPAAVNFESAAGWDELLQTAARLKVVLGVHRRVVAVTGIDPADGGPLLAAKLGAALAQIDHGRVLVVEANQASRRIGRLFGVASEPGFLDVLEHRVELNQAVHPMTPDNLFVLPLGVAVGSLATSLTSDAGVSVMSAIREQFRHVIVDAGIIHRDAAGMLLASLADGVVAAVAIGTRRREEVITFHDELKRLNIPLFGVVLTRIS
jgi:Mrp family chromosome partitioning ATPase